MHKAIILFAVAAIGFSLNSCCDPVPRNSFPTVLYSTYADTAIKDIIPELPPLKLDSLYYPIYSFDIKNTGTEADTFTVIFDRENSYFDLSSYPILYDQQYVLPGETKTFKTYGPVPSNALDTAKYRYLAFYTSTLDSIPISIMRPTVTIYYGATPNGPEDCGSPAKQLVLNVDKF